MNREFANPHKYARNLLRRRTFVSDDDTADFILSYEFGQVGIFSENGNVRKGFRQELETFIDKTHDPLAASRRIGEVLRNFSTGLCRSENKNVVRPVAQS